MFSRDNYVIIQTFPPLPPHVFLATTMSSFKTELRSIKDIHGIIQKIGKAAIWNDPTPVGQ